MSADPLPMGFCHYPRLAGWPHWQWECVSFGSSVVNGDRSLKGLCSRLCAPASITCRMRQACSNAQGNIWAVAGSGVAIFLLLFPSCSTGLAVWLLCSETCRALPLTLGRGLSLRDDLRDGSAVASFRPVDTWSRWSRQLEPIRQALLVPPWLSGVIGRCADRAAADASLPVLRGRKSKGDGCVAAESLLRGLGSLAWLRCLLDCERQLLGLGAPVLELRARILAGGTVLDVHKSPRVRGFITAAGVLPAGIFSVWRGVDCATSVPLRVGVLGLGLSGANAGLAWFDTGAVLVVFFTMAVFVMLLTVEVRKMSSKEVGGFPLRYCSKDVQKNVMESWVMSLST